MHLVHPSHGAQLLQQLRESVRELHRGKKHPATFLRRAKDLRHVWAAMCVIAVLLEENLPLVKVHVPFFRLQPLMFAQDFCSVEIVIFVFTQRLWVEADGLRLFEGRVALELAVDLLGQSHIECF